jgi:hypothetical protein
MPRYVTLRFGVYRWTTMLLPSYVLTAEAKKIDVRVAQSLDLGAGSIVAMDRGYNDYALFGKWTEREVVFVTRLKENAAYEVVESAMRPLPRNILADKLIRFTGPQAVKVRTARICCGVWWFGTRSTSGRSFC